jgi:hypothetical protein
MMATKNNIVPKHCQENWLELSAEEKIRFCTLCQKNFFEVDVNHIQESNHLCERYQSNFEFRKQSKTEKILRRISKYLIKKNQTN